MVKTHTVSLACIQRRIMKLDLQRVSFIEDARRMLNGATLSVCRLYSITGVDWLIAASINFSSKSLFWPDVIMVAAVDLDLLQSVSLAIGYKGRWT